MSRIAEKCGFIILKKAIALNVLSIAKTAKTRPTARFAKADSIWIMKENAKKVLSANHRNIYPKLVITVSLVLKTAHPAGTLLIARHV